MPPTRKNFCRTGIRVVNNGIPDPCPDFTKSILPQRKARLEARRKLLAGEKLQPLEIQAAGGDPHVVKVLFLAHCMREKGLFDAMEGVALANAQLKQTNSPLRMQLTVAGEFVNQQEQEEFDRRVSQLESEHAVQTRVDYLGFVNGEAKTQVFTASDCFCFPTYYHAESFGLSWLKPWLSACRLSPHAGVPCRKCSRPVIPA